MTVRLKDNDGDEVPDLMLCVQGNEDGLHATRIRNRDKNASMNIWEVLHAMVDGQPRPAYLVPTPRRLARRRVAVVIIFIIYPWCNPRVQSKSTIAAYNKSSQSSKLPVKTFRPQKLTVLKSK